MKELELTIKIKNNLLDDRYVELVNSVRGASVLILLRDRRHAKAKVLDHPQTILEQVRLYLLYLSPGGVG